MTKRPESLDAQVLNWALQSNAEYQEAMHQMALEAAERQRAAQDKAMKIALAEHACEAAEKALAAAETEWQQACAASRTFSEESVARQNALAKEIRGLHADLAALKESDGEIGKTLSGAVMAARVQLEEAGADLMAAGEALAALSPEAIPAPARVSLPSAADLSSQFRQRSLKEGDEDLDSIDMEDMEVLEEGGVVMLGGEVAEVAIPMESASTEELPDPGFGEEEEDFFAQGEEIGRPPLVFEDELQPANAEPPKKAPLYQMLEAVFADMNPEDHHLLNNAAERITFEAKTGIINKGDTTRDLWVAWSASEVTYGPATDPNNTPQELAPGTIVGGLAFAFQRPRAVDVTVSAGTYIKIPGNVWEQLSEKAKASFYRSMGKNIGTSLKHMNERPRQARPAAKPQNIDLGHAGMDIPTKAINFLYEAESIVLKPSDHLTLKEGQWMTMESDGVIVIKNEQDEILTSFRCTNRGVLGEVNGLGGRMSAKIQAGAEDVVCTVYSPREQAYTSNAAVPSAVNKFLLLNLLVKLERATLERRSAA